MRHRLVNVESEYDQVAHFVRFAAQYAGDYGKSALDWVTALSLPELWAELRARYKTEKGERVIRPLYYWQDEYRQAAGAQDCDDQLIQFVARFIYAGVNPKDILIFEAKEPGGDYYCHIFAGLRLPSGDVIFLDCLPQSAYNRLDYPGELIRITTAADYL